ncbi:MAG: EspA/EspE family type VII secretion system effector, partial [Mycobacterium sp.]
MGVLDGFISTWSNARSTFGQGTPPAGEQYDKSGPLRGLQANVQSAAPGPHWSGTAAAAYDTANNDHQEVIGKLANLDQRLAAQVNQSAQVVTTGRQNLDAVRQWVLDAAASVPAGKNREQMLVPIVQKGLSQLTEIVTKSNGDLSAIGGQVRTIGNEYQALGIQKFAAKEGLGDDTLGVVGEDGKKELSPEDMEELTRKALAGDQEAAAKVDELLNGINNDQLGPTSKQHPLTPLQAELVGQMQAQMKPMSMDDLNAARDRLGTNKDILSNAMQVMSNPNVTFPRHDGDGSQVVSATPGGPLPNDGVLPGDTGALPDGVQNTLNQPGDFSGPPGSQAGYPGSQPVDWEGAERTRAANDMKNLADIVGDGDSRFQQGSQLDREMMSNAKEWLASQDSPDGRSQEHWGDDVVERVFDTAGRDTVVDHDMFTTDKDFMQDVLTHEWQDNGQSARTLTDWIDDTAYSNDPVVNARAGETASA